MSFLRSEALYRLQESPLMKLSSIINWEEIGKALGDLGRSGYGPEGYSPIQMVKGLILQAWHNLSDPGLEEALRVRLDFMLFTGFERDVPDETTFCRFRNLLTKQGLWERILKVINNELAAQGVGISPSCGAIIDATIIRSAARPQKEIEAIVIDRNEDCITAVAQGEVRLSADPDATWLKKGKKSYFGYKGFIVVEEKQGFIQQVHVTPAHVSEVRSFQNVVQDLKPERFYADKGYPSQENRQFLKAQGIKDGIMYKAARDRPLTPWQKVFNRLVSKRRYRVEQAFGTLKRRFQFERASYMTAVKVQTQMILKAIAFNLLKAVRQEQVA